jgi:hypothetical protein
MLDSHLGLMLLFAGFVSLVLALLTKDDVKEQIRFGVMLFAGFAATGIVLGWLMFAFPL